MPTTTLFWNRPLADLESELATGVQGLSSDQAQRRSATVGPNQIRERSDRSAPWEFLSRFRNPLVLILLAVAIPFTPVALMLGFVPLLASLPGALSLIVAAYLLLVHLVKRMLNRHGVTT
jgi:magnesium-transporting ATPase (P-type)